jgi:large subunit ribosomal protein L35
MSSSAASTVSRGIWSNVAKRSPSLTIQNPALRAALLSPTLPNGPVSMKTKLSKSRYHSPVDLDKIYPLAYQMLEAESEKMYKKVEEIDSKLESIKDDSELKQLKQEKEQLLVDAELNNPEVLYNGLYATTHVDRSQPVYRHYLKEQWKSYNRMLTMQRLESLSVIPDTLPTLEPEVHVQLKFPHNNVETWVEPGAILSSNVTSKPPIFEIVEFKESINDLYTVLIVNPDTPDVENDTFTTTLHWGLKDVSLSNTDSIIDVKKLDAHPEYSLVEYLPPVPEKNLGKQRFAVWIFRQDGKLEEMISKIESRENFNIRKYVEDNKLHAVGAHVWRSIYDLNVDNVRDEYGLPEGRIFTRGFF